MKKGGLVSTISDVLLLGGITLFLGTLIADKSFCQEHFSYLDDCKQDFPKIYDYLRGVGVGSVTLSLLVSLLSQRRYQ